MAKRPSAKPGDPASPAKPKTRRPRAAAPAAPSSAAKEPSVDDIRRRAYERYLERGGRHGEHVDDWIEAEKELRSKK